MCQNGIYANEKKYFPRGLRQRGAIPDFFSTSDQFSNYTHAFVADNQLHLTYFTGF